MSTGIFSGLPSRAGGHGAVAAAPRLSGKARRRRSQRRDSDCRVGLEQLHARFAGLTAGRVATCTPERAKVVTALSGILIATVDGRLCEAGDTRVPRTLPSISRPLDCGGALEDRAPTGLGLCVQHVQPCPARVG